MANRVTATEVQDIIDTDLTDPRIEAFITSANALVNEHLADEIDSDDLLKQIELWLSAHYIAATFERQAIEEEAGPARQKFSDVFGQNLMSTTYGQTASQLDPTDILAELGSGRREINIKAVKEEHEYN